GVAAFLRQPIGRVLTAMLSLFETVAGGIRRSIGSIATTLGAVALMAAIVAFVGALLSNMPQLTSELGRLWLIVGAAWFFFLRGDPFAKRLATSGTSVASLVRYVWPLACVVAVLIGIQLLTHDLGPLCMACYRAHAFVS